MTDRELLELAAKAAGYDKSMETEGRCDMSGNWKVFIKKRYWVGGRECTQTWDPLTDDGDALRLAVNLRMEITYDTQRLNLYVPIQAEYVMAIASGQAEGAMEPLGEDAPKAFRRAIVRAAAAIGEQA